METKERKIYHIILVVCSLFIGTLMAYADNLNKKIDSMQQPCVTCEIGNDVENWVLDVVYETDIFDKITEEEREFLHEMEEESLGLYYIHLIKLYGKYYSEEYDETESESDLL